MEVGVTYSFTRKTVRYRLSLNLDNKWAFVFHTSKDFLLGKWEQNWHFVIHFQFAALLLILQDWKSDDVKDSVEPWFETIISLNTVHN